MEVVLRICLSTLLSSSLSIAKLPNAIPPNLKSLIGTLTPFLSLQLPHFSCLVGATILPAVGYSLVGMVGSTLLLAASTVSNGLYVAIFALWALYCKTFYYGDASTKAFGGMMSHALILIGALISLSYYENIQNGIGVQLDVMELNINGSGEIDDSDIWSQTAFDLLQTNDICSAEDVSSNVCIGRLTATLSPPGESYLIESDNIFRGQMATISCEDDAICTITLPGGLWLVRGLWVWTGLQNPYALVSNFFIIMCYFLLCLYAGVLMPPIRTVRKMYSRGALPAAIADCVALIEANEEQGMNGESEGGIDNTSSTLKIKVVNHAADNSTGGKAVFTAFELRLLSNPLECTWPELRDVAKSISDLALFALTTEIRGKLESQESPQDKEKVRGYIKMLKASSTALKSGIIDKDFQESDTIPESDEEENQNNNNKKDSYFVRRFCRLANGLKANTASWVEAMNNPRYTGLKDVCKTYAPWIAPTAFLFKSLFWNLLLPFMPSRYNLRTTLVAVKVCVGAIILFILEVYVTDYKNFSIGSSASNDEAGAFSMTSTVPNVYSGWNITAYLFACRPTTESGWKKGFFRVAGTVVGGFFGWLGIIVCSGSYDAMAISNPSALVAWLTIITGIAASFSIPSGLAAFWGMDPHIGMFGRYVVLVQSLVIITVYTGPPGERDEIVVNRIIATATGAIMAMFIALIPPQVRGSDKEPMFGLLELVETSFKQGLRLTIENEWNEEIGVQLDTLSEEFMNEFLQTKQKIKALLDDASKLNGAPFLRVDKRMMDALQSLTVRAAYVKMWLGYARSVATNDEIKLTEEQRKIFDVELKRIVKRIDISSTDEEYIDDGGQREEVSIGSDREEIELLLHSARFINGKIELLRTRLEELPSTSFIAVCHK